jgi:hypothetical protein
LMTSGEAERAQTPAVLNMVSNVSASSEMKPGGDGERSVEDTDDEHSLLRGVYHLLCERLNHVSGHATDVSTVDEQLQLFNARVQSDMAAAECCSSSLTEFTEAALHAYALHRQLDKLMAANFLESTEDDNVHDWKDKCQALMEVERETSAPAAA